MNRLTDLSAIRALCAKYGFSLAKGFGQHFLTNSGICPKICEAAAVGPNDSVLEIGPGFGALTRELAARAKRVAALEVDARLAPVLAETLAGLPNVKLVLGDALKADLAALIQNELGSAAKLCANLPYNVAAPIIMRLLEERLPLSSITVMVQQEVAKRIAARPGERGAGTLSYAVHYYAAVRYNFAVSPGSFYPPPKVKSAVITLTPHTRPPYADAPQRTPRLFSLVRAGFQQRRKTLANALTAGFPDFSKPELAAALLSAGIAENARPEEVTLCGYIALEKALWPAAEAAAGPAR